MRPNTTVTSRTLLQNKHSFLPEKVALAGNAAVEQPPLIGSSLVHRHHFRGTRTLAANTLLFITSTKQKKAAKKKGRRQWRERGRAGG